MNIFEGSRRIAKLTAAGIALGFLIAFAYDNPEPVSVSYLITDGKTPPTRVDECPPTLSGEGKSRFITARSGRAVSIVFCVTDQLRATIRRRASENPFFRLDPSMSRGGDEAFLAQNIAAFLTDQTEDFTIPESDEGYITRLGWLNTAKSAGMHLLGMLASLAAFWAFTWAVGWIVRGFMGIPQGKDRKE